MNQQTKLAEAQLLGYLHAQRGYSIIDLISAMALTQDEWTEIQKESGLNFRHHELIEIEQYFKKQQS